MDDSNPIIVLDVGGSSIKSGIVTDDQHVQDIRNTPIDSSADAEQILGTLAESVRQHLDGLDSVRGVGIGFPSPFDYEQGISLMQDVAKYEAIYGVDVGAALRERLQRPDLALRFRNDAEAAIIGEARHGSGRPFERFVGITLGTGIGSAFVVNRQRVREGAGVPPHNGFLFPEMFRGQPADEWFGTRGLLKRFAQRGRPVETVKEAAEAVAEGDETLRDAFAHYGADLGAFLLPYLMAFDAEALIVLGGIARSFNLFGDTLSARVPVPVHLGSLGERAALLGAAALFAGDL